MAVIRVIEIRPENDSLASGAASAMVSGIERLRRLRYSEDDILDAMEGALSAYRAVRAKRQA